MPREPGWACRLRRAPSRPAVAGSLSRRQGPPAARSGSPFRRDAADRSAGSDPNSYELFRDSSDRPPAASGTIIVPAPDQGTRHLTVTFHALWILCALGAIVIAAAGAAHTRQLVAFAAGAVVAASVTGPDRLPDPVWAGALGVAAAAIYLCWPRHAVMSAAIGGAFAGMLTALLEVQGVPRVVALVV